MSLYNLSLKAYRKGVPIWGVPNRNNTVLFPCPFKSSISIQYDNVCMKRYSFTSKRTTYTIVDIIASIEYNVSRYAYIFKSSANINYSNMHL